MPDANRKEIERALRAGADALAQALTGIDEETAARRPHPDSWSVLECVEHIALTEAALLARLKQATPADASREDLAREARFRELALNRQRRIEAPDPVIPRPLGGTLAEARAKFENSRSLTMRFVAEFEGDLKGWLTLHPLITRPVNCYEMLLLMSLHPQRHAQQIEAVREQLLPPRSPME